MEAKEYLINSITITLSEVINISPRELQKILSSELHDYSVVKMETTMPSCGNKSATIFLMNKFVEAKVAAGMSKKTIYQYSLAVKQICDEEKLELNMITQENVRHFMTRMRINGSNNTTIRNKYMLLRSVFGFLVKAKYINYNPCEDVEPPREKPVVKKPLTDKEIESIKVACEKREPLLAERTSAMINFMLDTGVRVSEFCSIKIQDVDFDNKSVKVLGKGNKERLVYFSDRTLVRLQNYLSIRSDLKVNGVSAIYDDAYLFTSIRSPKEQMHPNGIRMDMKNLGVESGVLRIHPHLLRATFATGMAEKGVSIDIIAKLLGHADLRTVNRYVLLSEDKIHQMMKNIA